MFKGLSIRFTAGMLALTPMLAHAGEIVAVRLPAGIHVVGGLRPDRADRMSHTKPKMERLKAKAESWAVQTTTERQIHAPPAPRRIDPYQIVIEGANEGTTLTVTKKGPLQAIELPAVERLALRDDRGRTIESAKFRKIVNRDYNKQLAAAVAKARADEALVTAVQTAPSSAQPVVIGRPAALPTNTTLTVSGVDPFGRKYQSKEIAVDGSAYVDSGWTGWAQALTENQSAWVQERSHTETGGRFEPSEKAQIVKQNLRSTPVLDRVTRLPGYERVDGKLRHRELKASYVKVLGLAAFSPNSTVTIVNKRMEALGGEAAKHASVTFQSNSKGAGSIEIPADLGDQLRVVVKTRTGGEVQGSQTQMDINIPKANSGAKFLHDRYLAIE